jgi:predicted DNA-binding protein (UPF0251 family)
MSTAMTSWSRTKFDRMIKQAKKKLATAIVSNADQNVRIVHQ